MIEWRCRGVSYVLPDPFEERMTHLSFGGLRAVFDLGQQLRLDPDALVRDLLGIGLRLPDQRFQPCLQILDGGSVEAVVDLARVDQVIAFLPADIDAVELVLP